MLRSMGSQRVGYDLAWLNNNNKKYQKQVIWPQVQHQNKWVGLRPDWGSAGRSGTQERFTQKLELNQFSSYRGPTVHRTVSLIQKWGEELEEKEWRQIDPSRPSNYSLGCGGYCERRERCWERMVLRQTPEERRQTQTWKRNQSWKERHFTWD